MAGGRAHHPSCRSLIGRLHAGADVDDQPRPPGGGPDDGIDGVVDGHEVAGLAAVPWISAGRPERRAADEGGDHAPTSRPLPRAVHAAEGQGGELQRVPVPVEGEQVGDGAVGDRRGGVRRPEGALLDRQLPERDRAVVGARRPARPRPSACRRPRPRRAGWPCPPARCRAGPVPDPRPGTPGGRPRRAAGGPAGRASSGTRTSRLWNLSEPTCGGPGRGQVGRASRSTGRRPRRRRGPRPATGRRRGSRGSPAPPTTSVLMPGRAGGRWRGVHPPRRRAPRPSTTSSSTAPHRRARPGRGRSRPRRPPPPTRTPDSSTLDRTSAPAPTTHARRRARWPSTVAVDLGAGADGRLVHGAPPAPLTASRLACRYSSGRPVSIQ